MPDHLFQMPVSHFIDQQINEARTRAEQLTEEQLQAPNLAGKIEEIAALNFHVATLKPDARTGKRRTEKRARTDYGQPISIDVDIIDVKIPFDGWPKSFQLAPTHCKIIDTPAATGNGFVLVSLVDDQNLDRNVDAFIKNAFENLNSLARDIKTITPLKLQTAQAIANQRLEQIRTRKERDKTRSFPIE